MSCASIIAPRNSRMLTPLMMGVVSRSLSMSLPFGQHNNATGAGEAQEGDF